MAGPRIPQITFRILFCGLLNCDSLDQYSCFHRVVLMFPGVRAVHFVLKGWLGGGANGGLGIDVWGKNLGEFLRGREVEWALDFLGPEAKGKL